MLVERGGPKLFRRTRWEAGPKVQDRSCSDSSVPVLPFPARNTVRPGPLFRDGVPAFRLDGRRIVPIRGESRPAR